MEDTTYTLIFLIFETASKIFLQGLAFSRAANAQLWVCLLEKAYAKAHGSYRAISGGHIAEALLDLTGAPPPKK